jgi:hypothetical protein
MSLHCLSTAPVVKRPRTERYFHAKCLFAIGVPDVESFVFEAPNVSLMCLHNEILPEGSAHAPISLYLPLGSGGVKISALECV